MNANDEFKCGNCGCTRFTREKAESFIAFAKDYCCVECREQIPASTPKRASIVFIVIGLLLACLGALWILAALANVIAWILGGLLLIVGVRALIFGVTTIRE